MPRQRRRPLIVPPYKAQPERPALKNYPIWIDHSDSVNLREVGDGLFVGAIDAVNLMAGYWGGIVDLYGGDPQRGAYTQPRDVHSPPPRLLRWPFLDGDSFPEGCLTAIEAFCRDRKGPILLHCAAGLSRSASAAYAILRVHYHLSEQEALRRVKVQVGLPMPRTLRSAEQWVKRWKRRMGVRDR